MATPTTDRVQELSAATTTEFAEATAEHRLSHGVTTGVRLVDLGDGTFAPRVVADLAAADSALTGALTETAPATDTASSGLNGRLQRIAQRLTSLIALQSGASTAARTSVSALVADTAILAADPSRIAATVYNESTAVLYVGYGTTAVSLTNYSVQVPASSYLEVPDRFVQCAIRGYWAAANGAARVTVG